MTKVIAYTDGACSGNPGPGGWGVVLLCSDKRKELSGYEPDTTNNRMEIQAVIAALSVLQRPCAIEVYSDSAYVVHAFTQRWLVNWQRNGWKTSTKQPVLNKDLWQALLRLCETHKVSFKKVKGHASDKENNRCDELARQAIQDNRGRR
ncbi:MAG: ribonuclease HI [Oscillospiraceae bacterium]|nr:ribonuclease HI [Oscillospiraceae bacterium]